MTTPGNLFLISTELPELRIAEIRDGRLFDLHIERGGGVLGDVFKGRVENVLPGMDAAFVSIGLSRNALIYAGDVSHPVLSQSHANPTIAEVLRSGQEIVVQIARPPVGTKGARVTAKLSLAGRYVVLTTQSDSVGVSRRIESDEERARLRRIAEKLRPLDHGLIIRTEAEQISESDLAHDVHTVLRELQAIQERASKAAAPAVVHREMGLLGRLVRDRFNAGVRAVWIDSEQTYQTFIALAQSNAPELVNRISLYREPQPLFEKYGVAEDISNAQERIVSLPRGGCLVIDEAEALCAIDVNTAKFTGSGKSRLADTVLQTNLEAVEEATRQIRLRDIGGVIVIDFIDMERRRDHVQVLDALEAALKQDRTRTRIVQLSPSGLVEIRRRREGHSLRHLLHRPCPYCDGKGAVKKPATVAVEARRRVRSICNHNRINASEKGAANIIAVSLHPDAAIALLGPDEEYIRDLEASAQAIIHLHVDPDAHQELCQVTQITAAELNSEINRDFMHGLKPSDSLSPILIAPLLFPSKEMNKNTREPRFAVWEKRLVMLENAANRGADSTQGELGPIAVQIIETGRWFHRGKIVYDEAPLGEGSSEESEVT